MNLKEKYDRDIARMRREDPEYQAMELMLAVSERLRQLIAEKGLTKAALARRMHVSPQYVTKLLREEQSNLTLRQIAKIAEAIEAQVEWDFRPLAEPSTVPRWSCQTNVSTLYYSMQERGSNALSLAA